MDSDWHSPKPATGTGIASYCLPLAPSQRPTSPSGTGRSTHWQALTGRLQADTGRLRLSESIHSGWHCAWQARAAQNTALPAASAQASPTGTWAGASSYSMRKIFKRPHLKHTCKTRSEGTTAGHLALDLAHHTNHHQQCKQSAEQRSQV